MLLYLRCVALACLVSLFILSGCNKQAKEENPSSAMPPPEVSVVTVQPKNIPVEFEYAGQTAGSNETQVRARVSGILVKRLYEEGVAVKAGTALFQIDPIPYQTQLAQAQAQTALSEAQLNQAKREAARLMPLAAEKAISQKEADEAKSTVEIAQANFQAAQAKMKEAQLNVNYTTVVAPIQGITSVAKKSDGSLINSTDLLTSLSQTDPLYINFSITEADFLKISGDINSGKIAFSHSSNHEPWNFEVKIKLADGSIFPTKGRLNFISETVNTSTGGFDARAQIANPKNTLRPGQFVRVILTSAVYPKSIAIPQRAAIDTPMGKIVFTVTPDNKLAPRPVTLDGWSNGEWRVTKGLQEGDKVLVEGIIKAHVPGMTVKPVPFEKISHP